LSSATVGCEGRREQGGSNRGREKDEITLTCGSHCHVVSVSSMPLCKTTRWRKGKRV
jgi:hypothetical protein